MVQIPTDIRDTINRYLRMLEAHQIPIQQAVLFGSYAKGNTIVANNLTFSNIYI